MVKFAVSFCVCPVCSFVQMLNLLSVYPVQHPAAISIFPLDNFPQQYLTYIFFTGPTNMGYSTGWNQPGSDIQVFFLQEDYILCFRSMEDCISHCVEILIFLVFQSADMRKIFPFEFFHLGGDEVHTG